MNKINIEKLLKSTNGNYVICGNGSSGKSILINLLIKELSKDPKISFEMKYMNDFDDVDYKRAPNIKIYKKLDGVCNIWIFLESPDKVEHFDNYNYIDLHYHFTNNPIANNDRIRRDLPVLEDFYN